MKFFVAPRGGFWCTSACTRKYMTQVILLYISFTCQEDNAKFNLWIVWYSSHIYRYSSMRTLLPLNFCTHTYNYWILHKYHFMVPRLPILVPLSCQGTQLTKFSSSHVPWSMSPYGSTSTTQAGTEPKTMMVLPAQYIAIDWFGEWTLVRDSRSNYYKIQLSVNTKHKNGSLNN